MQYISIGGWSNSPEPYSEITPSNPKPISEIKENLTNLDPEKPLCILGAEPTIHPDFINILEAVKSFKEVYLPTNARMFFYKDRASLLGSHQNISCVVTLYGPSHIHNELTGTNSFDQTIKGIQNLLESNGNLVARIPILKHNIQEIYETVELVSEIGLKQIVLANPQPKGSLENVYKENIPKLSIQRSYINEILQGFSFVVYTSGFAPCQLKIHADHEILFPFIPRASYNQGTPCTECTQKEACKGMPAEYLAAHGEEELTPIKQLKPIQIPDGATPHQKILSAVRALNRESLIFISPDDVYYLLQFLDQHKEFWDLVYHSGYPIPILVKILTLLEDIKAIEIDKTTIKKIKHLKPLQPYLNASHRRLVSNPEFSQLTVCYEDLKERVDYVCKCMPAHSKLAVLGDDDFVSLMFASSGIFEEVIAFEIDERICSELRAIADEHGLPLKVVQHDLRKSMPSELMYQFDGFYTDSPYSVNGFSLFVSRGVDLLKKQPKKHGFASFSPELPETELVELPVQRVIAKMNLFIERKDLTARNDVPNYIKEKYTDIRQLKKILEQNWDNMLKLDEWYLTALGRKEYLFHFLTTSNTRPAILGEYAEELYYGESPLAYYMNKEYIKERKKEFENFDFK